MQGELGEVRCRFLAEPRNDMPIGVGLLRSEVAAGSGGEGRHETYPYREGRRRELEEGGGFADDYFFAVLVFGPDVEVDGGVVDVSDFCVVGEGVAVPDWGDELGG